MTVPRLIIATAAALLFALQAHAQTGPDLILAEINGMSLSFGGEGPFLIGTDGAGTLAYAAGVAACNIGDQPLSWDGTTNQHPVFAQNLYRLQDGRFTQIGLSWVKHGLGAIQGSMCGTCVPVWSGQALGVGCSDIYSAGLNGFQGALGPRSAINAATGAFSAPGSPTFQILPPTDRRLRVAASDLDPTLNPGARYFLEGQAIHPVDAQLGNNLNNASYREVVVGSTGPLFQLAFAGTTIAGRAAIHALKSGDPSVGLRELEVPGDGRLTIGYRARLLPSGLHRHEFALHNFDSDRGAASLQVRFAAASSVANPDFHDIAHHSGEAQNSIDWTPAIASDSITWSCAETFAQNPDANALRWGTVYSFWFDSTSQPIEATVGLFKPGIPSSLTVLFPFTVSMEQTPAGDLSITLAGVPPDAIEGWCLFSLDTALARGAGPLAGLAPDALTSALIALAPSAGPPVHWSWPVTAPDFPASVFVLPAAAVSALASRAVDAMAIAVTGRGATLTATPVFRFQFSPPSH